MKKVLIIRGSAIGDIVECLPVASAIKNNFDEEFEIHWMVRRKFKKILEGNRFIDKILYYEDYKDLWFRIVKRIYRRKKNLDGLNSWLKYSSASKLKKEHYDIVINLHGKLDGRMFNVMCNAPQSITAPWLDFEDTVYGSTEHRTVENLEALKILNENFDLDKFIESQIDYGWSFSQEEIDKTNIILKENNCDGDGYIVLVLGTTWQSKNYPIENWIKLVELMECLGKKIVFVGDGKDKVILNKITSDIKSGFIVDLIGKTSLKEMIIVLTQAAVVVGGDTGPLHIADSLNVKTITLMNPTFPDKYAPFGKQRIVLTAEYPCKNCHIVKCPKGICCMKYIDPQKVFKTIETCLKF